MKPITRSSCIATIIFALFSKATPANAEREPTTPPANETKPDAAPPNRAEMPDPVARIRQIDAENFSLDDIHFNRTTGEIRFPAKVNMTQDQIEYIIVTEKGKTHESLLSTTTSPFILNVVMLLCRYQPSAEGLIQFVEREGPDGGGTPATEPEPTPKNPFAEEAAPDSKTPTAPPAPAPSATPNPKKSANNLLQIFLRYKKDDKEVEVLLDDWILNTETKSSLADVFWVYTGSDILSGGDFAAELEGSIIAIYVDRMAMFNNPIKGNDNDDIWEPFTKRMPPVDTPVDVILRPFKPKPPVEK